MKYRTAPLMNAEDVGASGTKVVNIDLESAISAIDIKFKVTKVLDYMTAGVPANLTRIELVDGSERLFSLTGYECQALGYYNRPNRQLEHGQELAANSEEAHFPIDFGCWLWDEELAFDPKRHTNPQLRITFDENASDTSVSENEMEITGFIFDEKQPSPRGFLSAIEEYSYTLGADNSFETIDLPDDRIVRQILVRAFQELYEPWYSIDEARLDENNLGRVVFEYTNLENYYRMMKSFWQAINIRYVWNIDTTERAFYTPPTGYWANCVVTGHGTAGNLTVTVDDGRGGHFGPVSSVNGNFHAYVSGYLPWHCYQFPLGKPNDPDDWWDPKGNHPRLRLRASTGATSSTGQVVMEELRPY